MFFLNISIKPGRRQLWLSTDSFSLLSPIYYHFGGKIAKWISVEFHAISKLSSSYTRFQRILESPDCPATHFVPLGWNAFANGNNVTVTAAVMTWHWTRLADSTFHYAGHISDWRHRLMKKKIFELRSSHGELFYQFYSNGFIFVIF